MHFYLYRICLSDRQFINRPLEQKSPLHAEKSSPISEINQTQVMEQQKSPLESTPEIKLLADMEM